MVNIYIIEDDDSKIQNFKKILERINLKEGIQCRNGFGDDTYLYIPAPLSELLLQDLDHITNIYQINPNALEMIKTAINDENGFWLLDLDLKNSESIEKKIIDEYIANKPHLVELYNNIYSIFTDLKHHRLSCAIATILIDNKLPFRFISTVGRGYEMDDVLELTHIENISTFPSREKTDIARIDTCASEIARAIRSSKQSFSAYDFVNKVINYTMLDLHILDKTNKPVANTDIFEPIEYVSKFLKYITSDDFNADFHIWNNFCDKQSYQFNIIEESLKAIVTKNASLFNLFIWAWGTFIIVFEDDNTEQNQGLKYFKDSLHKMVEMYEKAKENQKSKAYSEWGKFIRYQSVWAAKSQEEYLNTVYAYEEMLRALFRNQFTQKSTIKKIEFTTVSLKFYLEIDGNKLIQRLNTVHQNLIDMFDDREFSKGHLTSMKILRYWLLSQVSNTTSNKNRNEPGNIQWGSGSGFSIQNRKNNDHSTGITLIFSL